MEKAKAEEVEKTKEDLRSKLNEKKEELNKRFEEQGLALHLSEVKGPVLDRLHRTAFMDRLSGNLYLSQHQAFRDLCERLHYSALAG